MEFLRRASGTPRQLAILPAAFDPPTLAHLALIEASLEGGAAQEVLCVLPRRFPHKEYERVTIEERLEMVLEATAQEPRISVGISEGGLFADIASECRAAYGEAPELWFLCGRDAAQRIVEWPYGDGPPITRQLEQFRLLVAPRGGWYQPPEDLTHAVHPLEVAEDLQEVSSTEVRHRVKSGQPWEHLVPPAIKDLVRIYYG
jgi:nicotinate-nucleotide adenylyltransferase